MKPPLSPEWVPILINLAHVDLPRPPWETEPDVAERLFLGWSGAVLDSEEFRGFFGADCLKVHRPFLMLCLGLHQFDEWKNKRLLHQPPSPDEAEDLLCDIEIDGEEGE